MASILDSLLSQGKTYGTYVPPAKVTSPIAGVQAVQKQAAAPVAKTPAQIASTAAAYSGGGNTTNYTTGNYSPQSLTQSQRQSLWEANGHSGTAPVGYGGEGAPSQPVDQALQLAKDTIAAITKANSQYQEGVSAYDKANPFTQSDIMAKEAKNAASLVNPYYDQLLTNYMQGVTYQRGNTIQDEMRTISKLQADSDAFQGQAKASLATALTQAGQHYSDAGGYDSGARNREQGVQSADTDYSVQQNERQKQYDIGSTTLAANREVNQTLPLQTLEEQQGVSRNRATDIASTQNQFYNYDVSQNSYNRAQAGVKAIQPYTADGQTLQVGGALPGMNSYDTQQALEAKLPGVIASPYGGHALYDTTTA